MGNTTIKISRSQSKNKIKHAIQTLLLCVGLLTSQLHAADLYPVSRRTGLPNNTWASAGLVGGRPTNQPVCTNVSPGISLSQLNQTIQNCPSGQVVQMAPGNYSFGGGKLMLTKNGVVLRGSVDANGFPSTFLSDLTINFSPFWYPSGPSNGWPAVTAIPIESGLSEGSTSITLQDVPGANLADFGIGDIFLIDQRADDVKVLTDTQADTYNRTGRPYNQALHIVNRSGRVIQFEPPLIGTYWSTNQSPEAVGWSSSLGASAKNIGLENLDIVKGTGGEIYTIRMGPAYNCWIHNIRITVNTSAAIRMSYAVQSEITHSIFHDTTGTGSGTYAVLPAVVTASRVEDNIFYNLSLAMPTNSAVGCSFSFNYGTGPYPYSTQTWFAEYFFPHGGHVHHTLYEGNWLDGPIYFDQVFNTNATDNGIVRNRIVGWEASKTSNNVPITFEHYNHNNSILGNILGANNYHTSYSQMYDIAANCQGTLIKNNYNTVDDGIHSTELIGSETMRDSYAYDSRPSWWGDLPWPPFDPSKRFEVNVATNIPAGYRHINHREPPSGPAVAPSITTQPQNQSVLEGATVSFSVVATGNPPPTYQWRKGTTNLSNGSRISGANSATLTITGALLSDAGSYNCVATNATSSAQSSSAQLTVTASPPVIVTQPVSQTVVQGNPANFSVSAAGSPPLSYQWKRGGVNISGANQPTYSLPTTSFSDSGSVFTVLVSNGQGSVLSNPANLTVTAISTTFNIGDRAIALLDVLARANPTLFETNTGLHSQNELGIVIGGPVEADGWIWWQINFDSGFDGWATETLTSGSSVDNTYLGRYNVSQPTHPADTDGNWEITINEVTTIGLCWRSSDSCPPEIGSTDINDVTSAGLIWRNGGTYTYDGNLTCPACWQPE